MAKSKKSKPKRDIQIADIYTLYDNHLNCQKTATSEIRISNEKENQSNFYYGSTDVIAPILLGHTSLECKIKKADQYHYTLTYKSDAIEKRLLTRLDAGAGTHRNTAPDIPLHLTSVPTPHFHRYREDGYDIAYPIDGLDYSDESSTKFDYKQGFSYFCNKLYIKNSSIDYTPTDILPLTIEETDPNEDVEFP